MLQIYFFWVNQDFMILIIIVNGSPIIEKSTFNNWMYIVFYTKLKLILKS